MHCDIILLNCYSRVQAPYLPIIKYMSPDASVGLCDLEMSHRRAHRTEETQRKFELLAYESGAKQLSVSERHSCSILILPQFRYSPETMRFVLSRVEHEKLVVMNSFGYGLEFMDDISQQAVDAFLVWDSLLLSKKAMLVKQHEQVLSRFETITVGSPFVRYPVFPDFSCDYMVAFPTHMGFDNSLEQLEFMFDVATLLGKLEGDEVLLKLHNVRDGGHDIFSTRRYPVRFSSCTYPLAKFLRGVSPKMDERIDYLGISKAYGAIKRRVKPLSHLTEYHNFNLELLLPGVQKGLVTGNSASIWFALYNRLPVYNCGKDFHWIVSPTLRSNMDCFGLPPCRGMLEFSNDHFAKVSEEARQADLLEVLKEKL